MELPASGSAPPPDGHEPLIEQLAGANGAILFAGMTDSGKTTMVSRVARAALGRGRSVAIVDCDVGQSYIGPPATIGMTVFREEPESFAIRRPDALAFVGSNQPFGFFLDMIAGAASMVAAARDAGADLILIDTSGIAPTVAGIRLKQEKLIRIRPEQMVLLERGRELQGLAQFARSLDYCRLHRTPVSRRAHVKPDSLRKGHRRAGFAHYFKGSRTHGLPLAGRGILGMSLFGGRILSPAARLRVAELLGSPIIRAELMADRLSVVAAVRRVSKEGQGRLELRFPRMQVRIHPPNALDGLILGLRDGQGRVKDIGIVQTADFTNATLTLVTPCTDLNAIRSLHFGALRLHSDTARLGVEFGSIRPGDL